MTASFIGELLQFCSLLACAAVACRVIQVKLYRKFPVFAWYFAIPLCLQVITVRYGICSSQLCRAYPPIEALRNIAYIVAMWELVSAVFRPRTVAVIAAVSAGLLICIAAPGSNMYHGVILSILKLERGLTLALGGLTLAVSYVASKYQLRPEPQARVLLTFWGVWFLGDSATLTAASLLPAGWQQTVNNALALFEIVSYAGWALLLTRPSERAIDGQHPVAACL